MMGLGKQSFQRQEALVAVPSCRSKSSKLRAMKMPIICENASYRSVRTGSDSGQIFSTRT